MRPLRMDLPGSSDDKESCNEDPGSIPGLGMARRKEWRKEWQSIPAFLPGESHGQRSLAGHGTWGCKESDTAERLTLL